MADAIEFVELGEMEGDDATIDEGLATLAALALPDREGRPARADELMLKEKQMQIDAAYKADKLEADQERDGVRMGIDIAKSREQAARQQPTKGKPSTT